MATLGDLWHRVWSTQPDPPRLLVVVTGVLALVAVAWRPAWTLARNAVTIAHEGGHALVAIACGRRLRGIRLHSDTSGLTVSSGRPAGAGMVFSLAAGYVTPSLLGLAGAGLLGLGRITLLLWVSLVLLFAVLVMIRNGYGIVAVLAVGALVFLVSWFASPTAQAAFAYAGVWFLLLGGVRPVGELQRLRSRGYAPSSDADQLAHLTRVPGLLWVAVFGLMNVAVLALGGYLLVKPLLPAT
jgi:Peptidase M50B-like